MLEDMGFEAVDNMPLTLLRSLVSGDVSGARDLAIGIDVRTRNFDVTAVLDGMDQLINESGFDTKLVFLDSSDEVLRRRFTETPPSTGTGSARHGWHCPGTSVAGRPAYPS